MRHEWLSNCSVLVWASDAPLLSEDDAGYDDELPLRCETFVLDKKDAERMIREAPSLSGKKFRIVWRRDSASPKIADIMRPPGAGSKTPSYIRFDDEEIEYEKIYADDVVCVMLIELLYLRNFAKAYGRRKAGKPYAKAEEKEAADKYEAAFGPMTKL